MKIKFSLLLTFVFILNIHSQSRENKELITFSTKSQKLTKAIGWKLNSETGKWISNKNVILERKCTISWVSHEFQNFNWMQFAKIEFNNEDYFVLLLEKQSGSYKYKSINEGWQSENRTYFYILQADSFNDLIQNIEAKSGKDHTLKCNLNGYITDKYKILGGEHLYIDENLLAKITKELEKTYTSDSSLNIEPCLVINSQTTDGIDVVRFRIPDICYLSEERMKTSYFEVEINEFKEIFEFKD